MGNCAGTCQSIEQKDILLKLKNKDYEKLVTSFKSENDSVNQGLLNLTNNNSSIFHSNKYLQVINVKKPFLKTLKGEQIFNNKKKKNSSYDNLIVINKIPEKKSESKSINILEEKVLQNQNYTSNLISSHNVDIINSNEGNKNEENKREENNKIDLSFNNFSIQSNNNNTRKKINHPIYEKLLQHSKNKEKFK